MRSGYFLSVSKKIHNGIEKSFLLCYTVTNYTPGGVYVGN